MTGLASLPTWVLAVGWLVVGGLAATLAWSGLRRVLAADQLVEATSVAGPLMPALGAVFALLAALSLAGVATDSRSAETDVSLEAAAASRLGWGSTSPGIDAEGIQSALEAYLVSTTANEWEPVGEGDEATMEALARVEVAVRDAATADDVGSAAGSELLTSLGTLTSLRRQRLAVAADTLPDFYVAVVVASGLALIVNSAAVALRARRRVAYLTSGLVVVVSLAVALLFALSAPYRGGFVVDKAPVERVISDLQAGRFHG